MDHKFTEQIKQWLETPEAERDYSVGALYLLKLSGNQIMYRNIISQIDRRHDFVEYQLQKYYNFRVADLTLTQVEAIVANTYCSLPKPTSSQKANVPTTTHCLTTTSWRNSFKISQFSNVCASCICSAARYRTKEQT